jgi:predicted metalloprotease with PDZ domain
VSSDPAVPHGWNVAHEPEATLIATYELRAKTPDPLSAFGTHYEPVVRDDLMHLIGQTGLIFPQWLESRGPVDIRWSWSGFEQHGWRTLSSFDSQGGRARRPLSVFRHAIFLAGRVRLHEREVRGGRLRVAVYGDDWGFRDEELVDLVQRIVDVEREFVGDFNDPEFLVTVVPTGSEARSGSFSLGGTGLTQCFALFLAPGVAVEPSSPHRDAIIRLLAHEYFHTWNGGKIPMDQPEELVYWFSEGFTDFFTTRLLRRAGLIDDTGCTRRLNEMLKKLWLSPVATEPAETIRRDFWTRHEVKQLPYQRGEIAALMLDEEIRQVSDGRRSLDDVFKEILAQAPTGETSETNRLLERFARWTSPEFAQRLRSIVVDGALPSPPPRVTEPAAALHKVESFRYDIGFDLDKTLKEKIVTGVREGSRAQAAGLREGLRLVGASLYPGDPDREIEISTRDNGQTRAIRFFPRGEPVQIPQYRLDTHPRTGE